MNLRFFSPFAHMARRDGVYLVSSKESIVYAYGGKGIPPQPHPHFYFLRHQIL